MNHKVNRTLISGLYMEKQDYFVAVKKTVPN